ncbi:MAG TPA: glycoside hydrolase family 31 protein, partial [Chitinophagales bacterium]|nr:glycoside hydrolase family 31 protein [Chitinophagales bacterium]
MVNKYLLAAVLCLLNLMGNAQTYNPVANPKAVITAGNARFTVLTERLIRMEYSPDSTFTDEATITFVNRNLTVPDFEQKTENGLLVIKTASLQISYQLNSGKFSRTNLQVTYTGTNQSFTWRPGLRNKHNLKGTTRTLDGTSGKYSYQTLKGINTGDGVLSRDGWVLIDDSQKPVFDKSDWPWVQNNPATGNTDWYLFAYGNNYKAALYDFTAVSGKISLPPKFAFGVWYSKYWKYSEQDFKDIVAGYEKNGIPLDVLVIDMDWHMTKTSDPEVFARYKPEPDGWTGFTWSKKYFPDYAAFLNWTNNKNIKTCLNLHPASGVQPHEAAYARFA